MRLSTVRIDRFSCRVGIQIRKRRVFMTKVVLQHEVRMFILEMMSFLTRSSSLWTQNVMRVIASTLSMFVYNYHWHSVSRVIRYTAELIVSSRVATIAHWRVVSSKLSSRVPSMYSTHVLSMFWYWTSEITNLRWNVCGMQFSRSPEMIRIATHVCMDTHVVYQHRMLICIWAICLRASGIKKRAQH